jgi:mycoredoxin-dependent peroxiredoxin
MSSLATRLARFSSVSSPNPTDLPPTGLSVGTPAPDFRLRDQFGQEVTLSSFAGQKTVALVFFPWAFSNVCTSEMAVIRDRLDEFLTFDTEVLAISTDATYSLRVFADTDGLNFPLLSDFWPHGSVATSYGVFDAELGVARRSSFVIDKEGVIRWAVHHELPQARDLGEHLAHLHQLD